MPSLLINLHKTPGNLLLIIVLKSGLQTSSIPSSPVDWKFRQVLLATVTNDKTGRVAALQSLRWLAPTRCRANKLDVLAARLGGSARLPGSAARLQWRAAASGIIKSTIPNESEGEEKNEATRRNQGVGLN